MVLTWWYSNVCFKKFFIIFQIFYSVFLNVSTRVYNLSLGAMCFRAICPGAECHREQEVIGASSLGAWCCRAKSLGQTVQVQPVVQSMCNKIVCKSSIEILNSISEPILLWKYLPPARIPEPLWLPIKDEIVYLLHFINDFLEINWFCCFIMTFRKV